MNRTFNFRSKTIGVTPEFEGHDIEVCISISCSDPDGCDAEAEFEYIWDLTTDLEIEYDTLSPEDRAEVDKRVEELCYKHGHEAYVEGAIDRADDILDAWKDGTYE